MTKSIEVRERTGCVVVCCQEQKQSQDTVAVKGCLGECVTNKERWASDDQHHITLFNKMSGAFSYVVKVLRYSLSSDCVYM